GPQMLWKNNRDKHYFIGVYPTAAISDFTAGEYKLDVTKQEDSDLLVAVNKDGLSYNADEQQTVPLIVGGRYGLGSSDTTPA
ncbi:fimbrillin family protein, partial [Vibrio parahaemolyticus]|nr:fimbrillin family protein [Vibrio parahaemolyticus]